MTPTLTHRHALAQARRTYDAIYGALLEGATAESRARLDRIYTRGRAAFAEQVASDSRLSQDSAEAFRAYMNAASTGDGEAKLSWLKMMPSVMSEVTAAIEPSWVLGPMKVANTFDTFFADYVLNYDSVVFAHTEPVTAAFTIKAEVVLHDWVVVYTIQQVARPRFAFSWPRWGRRTEAANKQATLALAA